MGKSIKKKFVKLRKKNQININNNSTKIIIYKPYSIILNEKREAFNNLKESKRKDSYKINILKSLIKDFDLDEEMMDYYFLLLYKNAKLNNKTNIKKFIKYMFSIKQNNRINCQNAIINYLSNQQKKQLKSQNMKDLFFDLLKEIFELKINNQTPSPISLIENLKNKDKYYVTNKKYIAPLSFGNDEAIYQENIKILFKYLTLYDEEKFRQIIKILNIYIPIIISDEFKSHFSNRETLNLMIDYLFILLFVTVFYNNCRILRRSVSQYFFENKADKIELIEKIVNMLNLKEYIIDKENNIFSFTFENAKISFNIYNYSLNNIVQNLHNDINDFKEMLNKREYYSLEYSLNCRRSFPDQIHSEMKNLYEGILKSKAYEECLSKIKVFKNSSNPYNNEHSEYFFNDLKNFTYYIYIPNNNIFGVTDKKKGITFINTHIIQCSNNIKVNGFLNSVSQTWTHCHEYGFHWPLCYSNSYNLNRIDEMTPDIFFEEDVKGTSQNKQIISNKTFSHLTNYDKFDSGDKGEVYLFGNKLTNLYLNGALFISNVNNWNKSLDEFRNSFSTQNNDKVPSEINESNLSKLFFNNEELKKNKRWFQGHIKTRKSEDNENENDNNENDSFINISLEYNKFHK